MYEAIHALAGDMDNPEMLRALWKMAADGQPELWPFLHLVVRLWLISPSESVVESMAGIVKVVFGPHRRLLHENAAKELIIRWNGPELCSADGLVNRVQQKYRFNFSRSSVSIAAATEGTVIARYKSQKCPRLSYYE